MSSETPGQVTVVGSVNLDLVARMPRLPRAGETVTGGSFSRHHGGKGANQAVAAARFGARVRFVGAVGRDELGDAARRALQGEGIDVTGLRVLADVATGVALITVDAGGENQIAVAPGANARLDAPWVRWSLQGSLRRPGVLLVNLEISDGPLAEAAVMAYEAGLTIVVNAAPARPLPEAFWELHPLLVLNEGEVDELVPGRAVESSARVLAEKTGSPVIVTLGKAGALMVEGRRARRLPGHRVDAVDTTGAGDTVCGVMAAQLAAGLPVDAALRMAMAAAALSVTVVGAREGMPARAAVETLLKSPV